MSDVHMRVSGCFLTDAFKLPDAFRIIGASYDPNTGVVTFTVHTTVAPPGTVEMRPLYTRSPDIDPVTLHGIEWLNEAGSAVTR